MKTEDKGHVKAVGKYDKPIAYMVAAFWREVRNEFYKKELYLCPHILKNFVPTGKK